MSNSRRAQIKSADGPSFNAHISQPEQPNGCGVVVLQEIFGVTKKIRGYSDLFAAAGYVALAPDLFWRMQPDVELSYSEEDVAKAVGLLKRFDETAALSDIARSVAYLRDHGVEHVGLVGFCLGGKLAPLALAQGAGEVAVGFYGVGLDRHADTLASLRWPAQLHFGDQDTHMAPEAVTTLEGVAARNPNVEVFRYAEAGHAFFRYDLRDEASRTGYARMMKLLETTLPSRPSASAQNGT
jgi:carboxymethylenebutenolidase